MANSNMISGIHNWCDRWCERCPFVSRCAVGAADAALPSEAKDMNNEAFWKVLSDSFTKALEMLDKAAKEHGIDINNFSEEELEESKREWEDASERADTPFAGSAWITSTPGANGWNLMPSNISSKRLCGRWKWAFAA